MQIFFIRKHGKRSIGMLLMACALCMQSLFAQDDSAGKQTPEAVAVYRHISDSALRTYQKNEDYGYANDPAYWKKETVPAASPEEGSALRWLRGKNIRLIFYIFFSLAIIYVIFLVWKDNGFNLFQTVRHGNRRLQSVSSDRPVIDLEAAIAQSIADKDWSAAIRFMYLKMISLQGTQHADFGYLHRVYEYVFYGGFKVSQEQFNRLEARFKEASKTISS